MTRAPTNLTFEPLTHKGKPRCQVATRQGAQCGRPSVPGTSVCRGHGGTIPQVAQAGAARELLAAYSGEPVAPLTDPYNALATFAGQMEYDVTRIRERVMSLWESWESEDDFGRKQLRPVVELWERVTNNFGRLLIDIGRLDLAERITRVGWDQVQRIMGAIEGAHADTGLDEDTQRRWTAHFMRRLERITGTRKIITLNEEDS